MGFDGSSASREALARAMGLAVEHSALLTIAGVVPEPRLYASFGVLVLPCTPETLRQDAERDMQRLLAEARDEVPANVSLTTQLLHGRPARALAELAERGGYDLVVTGERPRKRLRRGARRAGLARAGVSVLAIR